MIYRGEQLDSDLGPLLSSARYYNPATGRFISRDPSDPKDLCNSNRYLYSCADPVNRLDPLGLANAISYARIIALITLTAAPAVEELGQEEAGAVDVAGTVLRAMYLQMQIYSQAGFFAWTRTTVAVADVSEEIEGPITRYVAVSSPKLIPLISRLLEPNEILLEGEGHAEIQLIKATASYAFKYSIGAGRALCIECAGEAFESGFKAFGPNGNPWFH